MTDNEISFAIDSVSDTTMLTPNPFSLTLTLGLADYTQTVTQEILVEVACEVYSVTFDSPVTSALVHEIKITPE